MKNISFNGVLLVHKDKHCTSHDVVQKIRYLLNQKAVGHAGTLDPMATGLLVILLGSATKLSTYLLNADKRYKICMQFGWITDSYDAEGTVIQKQKVSLAKDQIKQVIQKNIGDLELLVPPFSAIKVKGKKLYAYARAGEPIKRPCKKMSFYDLNIHYLSEDQAELSISCSKGTYIRSWVHELGQQLKVGACLTSLKRLSSGQFSVDDSVTVSKFQHLLDQHRPKNDKDLKTICENSFFLPSQALSEMPCLELNNRNTQSLLKGFVPEFIIKATQNYQIQVNQAGRAQVIKGVQGDRLVTLLVVEPFKKIKILKNFQKRDGNI